MASIGNQKIPRLFLIYTILWFPRFRCDLRPQSVIIFEMIIWIITLSDKIKCTQMPLSSKWPDSELFSDFDEISICICLSAGQGKICESGSMRWTIIHLWFALECDIPKNMLFQKKIKPRQGNPVHFELFGVELIEIIE